MRTIALAGAAVLTLQTGASAATACKLVPDPAKDTHYVAALSDVSGAALDIRSIDVATGRTTLVVVMRMATTNLASDPAAALGMTWDVTFRIANVDHRFGRRVGSNGTVINDSATAGGRPISGVKTKVGGNAVQWTVPRSAVPKLKGRGAVLTGFYGSTWSPLFAYDQAPNGGVGSGARYVDRQRSCVKAA